MLNISKMEPPIKKMVRENESCNLELHLNVLQCHI